MEPTVSNENRSNTILSQVQEGMRVCESDGQEIGTVRRVYLGAVSDTTEYREVGPATASDPSWRDDNLIDNLAEAFSADDPLPETLRGRLLREGFIRIDTHGLFASDRFALPDQIDSVSDDCVRLKLTRDELIKD